MGCVQSYFKRAHNAGISPSSTQESNSKQPVSEDGTRPIQEERSITEEPESNDTSYGVEATAVRTLAATTGTVAILGTTAKTGEKKNEDAESRKSGGSATPAVVETIPEEQEETTLNVEKAVVHEEEKLGETEERKEEVVTEIKNEENQDETNSKPSSTESRPSSKLVEISENKDENLSLEKEKSPSPAPTETKEDNSLSTSPAGTNKSPASDSNKSESVSPNAKSPVLVTEENETKKDGENSSEQVVSELLKEKEEDASKSISSERLKTNSISNTTLSSDSIVEFENNSVKQSPSADKVIESFDSSSTVEFVDTAVKDSKKEESRLEDNKTNPAGSVSSDLSNMANLPLDGAKTPDVLSPEEPENKTNVEDLPPPPPLEEIEQIAESSVINDKLNNESSLEKEDVPETNAEPSIENQSDVSSSSKDILQNDENSLNSEISSNPTNSVHSVIKNDTNVNEPLSKTLNSSSPNASEDNNKAETGSPFSSDNNSSFNDNDVTPASPVTAVSLTPAPTTTENLENSKEDQRIEEIPSAPAESIQNHIENIKLEKEEISPLVENHKEETILVKNDSIVNSVQESKKEQIILEKTESIGLAKPDSDAVLTNGISSRPESPNEHGAGISPKKQNIIKEDIGDLKNSSSNILNGLPESRADGKTSEDAFGSPIDLSDEKVIAAATTIQASFRGFQTRQNLKSSDKNENDKNIFPEKIEKAMETPSNLAEVIDSNKETPETILENVDEKMIAAATTIQANFRGYQTRQTLRSKVDSGLPASEDTNQSGERKTPTALTPELIESVKEEVDEICKEAEVIAAERSESVEGMIRGVEQVVMGNKESGLPSVSESVLAVRGSATPPSVSEVVDADDTKEEVFDSLTDVDEKTIHAATTIQATFRGYQTRKALQDTQEQPDSMPDYPPPDALSLEDLPPPDFEALESSYSEDVPTEPLVPPPPPDSIIFNEEDEDELASLQKPPECDELPEHRLTLDTDSEVSDSSLSSAATKIQAGVRGYLTRKQIQAQAGTGTGTTSTSTNRTAPDSDGSLSVDGVRSAISTEEESEVTRHQATPDLDPDTIPDVVSGTRPSRSATKRMSLAEPPARSHAPIRSRALSVQASGPVVSDEDVWNTLKSEMSDAATKIQSNFRGYRARKQLQREDAMQMTSSSSQATPTPTSGSVDATSGGAAETRNSGEYHDIIALSPPNVQDKGGEQAATAGAGEGPVVDQPADGMVKRRADDDADAEAAAATKIQATYRGFKTRQEMRDVDRAAAKIQAGFRGYKVRKEMKKNGDSASVRRSSNPEGGEKGGTGRLQHSASLEEAATKIQAGIRGFLVRRRVQRGKSQQPSDQ